ncbi:MAG: hypothetical protein JRI23_15690 [Deltaproteobacteria bacterium]|jgi:hypothetical protein|nr:hypothetical protein [Deltaproteobacteria bacterium]MBW2533203.1 hypothetical protein [Deltaproteobacteria bacterium]
MVANATRVAAALAASLAAAGCGETSGPVERTIRLVVSTDLTVPNEIDGLTITGSRGGDVRFSESYEQPAVEALPDSMLLHNEQRLDDQGHEITTPIQLRVDGTLGGSTVVTRTAQLSFLNDEPAVLYLPLCRVCASHPDCGAGFTCMLGECESDQVDVSTLREDDGTQPDESPECPSGA